MSSDLILLVDDDPRQLKLGALCLRDAGFVVETARSATEALRKATAVPPRAILSDVLMEDEDGFALCGRVRREPSLDGVPIILLSAHYRDRADHDLAGRVGAADLVLRTPDFQAELDALRKVLASGRAPTAAPSDPTVSEEHLRRNAYQLTRLLDQARSAEERYRALFDNATDAISILSPDGVVLEVNARWPELMNAPREELIGRHIATFAAPGHEMVNVNELVNAVDKGGGRIEALPIRRRDGHIIYLALSSTVVELDGRRLVFAIGHDVTERIRAAKQLEAAEEKYRSLVERIPDVVWTATADARVTFITPNIANLCGLTAEEVCAGQFEDWADRIHPEDQARVRAAFAAFRREGKLFDVEYRWRRNAHDWVCLWHRAVAAYERDGVAYCDGMLSDVTERTRLEASLRQAQKMEAIGQLTGGIAHDFNNILAVILANTDFLMGDMAELDPRREEIEEIKTAAQRAATLTRQLLAFSRRQVLEATTVDLNPAVASLEKMLRRLIGEDIELAVIPGAALGSVRVDVGQIEQVIMNMVVNARDAMPRGGKLWIATANVEVDADHPTSDGSPLAGQYVMLSVKDTGSGMDAETQARIFEPFFTTKGVGKGTGLGLSTCYGIVKQSGGYICVASEPGHGTEFKIYFPRIERRAEAPVRRSTTTELNGSETILVIEDDAPVRAAVARILRERGYALLVAEDREAALALSMGSGRLDLIVSDVVMPNASGPEIVAEVSGRFAGVKALFMSGHTDHPLLQDGSLSSGLNFIAKPFSPEALAKKVREVLDG